MHQSRHVKRSHALAGRNGSTLLIVVALLGMLAFLGFVFYTFAKQERVSAASFSNAAKNAKGFLLDADSIVDFAIEQLFVGPPDTNKQSVLAGGRHSFLANMFGRDAIPWNGEGVNLVSSSSGQPHVDSNYDSVADATDDFLGFVDSPAANGGVMWGTGKSLASLPSPDVNYNSPNIDSIFLSYDGFALNTTLNSSRCLIPSFLRPQYLRNGATVLIEDVNQNGQLDAGEDLNGNNMLDDWYQFPGYANQVMRPHPNHICVDTNGAALTITSGSTTVPIRRYVRSNEYKALGLDKPFTTIYAADPSMPGSFAPPESTPGTNTPGSLGVWTPTAAGTSVGMTDIDLDVDTDGDGLADAILMDLGYPPIRRGDGKLVVPLFAVSIRDLNGLINLNASGNLNGNWNLGSTTGQNQFGFRKTGPSTFVADNLSKSNLGMSTHEINVQRALTADPINDTQLLQSEAASQLSFLLSMFDTTVNTGYPPQAGRSIAELANLEWLLFNVGRATFSVATTAITEWYPGNLGELSQFTTFLTTGKITDTPKAGFSTSWTVAGAPNNWPPVGSNPNPDDNLNYNEGEAAYNIRYTTPLDFKGSGQQFHRYDWGPDLQPGVAGVDDDGDGFVDNFSEEGWVGSDDLTNISTPLYGKAPNVLQLSSNLVNGTSATKYPIFWPAYSGYHSYNGTAVGGVRWGENQTTLPYTNASGSLLMRGTQFYSLFDDPTEAIIDPTIASLAYQTFLKSLPTYTPTPPYPLNATEVAAVTDSIKSDSVITATDSLFLHGSSPDVTKVNARSRLSQLMPANMSASQNAADIRKRFTTISQDRREFGFGDLLVGGIRTWESSPQFPPSLAAGSPNPYRTELFNYLQQIANTGGNSLKLNVNRWLVYDALTSSLGFSQLPEQRSPNDTAATTARQQMAQDIYTLLYTLCTVQGTSSTVIDLDYRTNIPTPAQAKEIAQFAVNLVDSLDADDTITAFYYDPDLSTAGGGWNQVYGTDLTQGTTDDTVVYGVERQLLTISESCFFSIDAVTPDSQMTIFDDSLTPAAGRTYVYLELQNVTPMNVTLASTNIPAGSTAAAALSTGDWRVRFTDPTETTTYNVLYFLNGLDATASNTSQTSNGIQKDASGNAFIASGATFTIGSQDGSDKVGTSFRTSDFRVDSAVTASPIGMSFTSTFVPVVPQAGFASAGASARVDTTGGKTVPNSSTVIADFPWPRCNLDLVWDYGDGPASPSRFTLLNGAATPGSLATSMAGQTSVRMILERRAAAGGTSGAVVWVPVDKSNNSQVSSVYTDIAKGTVTPPTTGATPTSANSALTVNTFNSYPRNVPLLRNTAYPAQAVGNTLNTSSVLTSSITLNSVPWQRQNDRDLYSLSELLLLPLYGADELTVGLAQVNSPGNASTAPTLANSLFYQSKIVGLPIYSPSIAASRFLRPDNPDYTLNGTTPNYGNRWYRLLNLLEVPDRHNQHQSIQGIPPVVSTSPSTVTVVINPADAQGRTPITFNNPGVPGSTTYSAPATMLSGPFNLPEYYGWPVAQGQINLNMVRHPQVLNAVLDDDQLINDPRFFPAASQFLDDATGDTTRTSWWYEFIKARDSRYIDPLSGTPFPPDPITGLYVPATANSRPFRSIDWIGQLAGPSSKDSPLENTILRSLPADAGTATSSNESRRLFEVGINATDHFMPMSTEVAGVPLHPSARFRLMSKLMNNTTTRSNTFGIFIAVQYYEAAEIVSDSGTTAVRIGGKIDDAPTNRRFLVVDRTAAVDQIKLLLTNSAGTAYNTLIPASDQATYPQAIFPASVNSFRLRPNTDTSGVRANVNGVRWRDLILHRQSLD